MIIMFSIENFYWVLYENLLKPSGVNGWFYYPFGTMQHLLKCDPILASKKQNHVLFYYDQEPIHSEDLGSGYDSNQVSAYSRKILRILANSERSEIKNRLCQDRAMLDWYYFYHGIAALDWFRDAKYQVDSMVPVKPFVSFNHLVRREKAYRMSLVARMHQTGLLSRGLVSFLGTDNDIQQELNDDTSYLSDDEKQIIETFLAQQLQLPIRIDDTVASGNLSADFGSAIYNIWQTGLFHVVNESVYYADKQHLTEKIFKPIVSMRPFILVAAPGNLAYLRSYGFKTFSEWIDESYDDIADPGERLSRIVNELIKISDRSPGNLIKLYREMLPVLEYNKRHFFGDFKNQIISELVDNFDTVICRWNNGRVDDREVPRCKDLGAVKLLLST